MPRSDTTFKKGQSGNPNGAPKKGETLRDAYIAFFSEKYKKDKKFTRFQKVLMTYGENAIEKNCSITQKHIIDQLIGKAKETVDANLTGDINITINKVLDK
ncbi:MAG: hypothetical protein GY928_11225 [Colwellia sp.]|nr:hypothetical protein [Colwellia sp.]